MELVYIKNKTLKDVVEDGFKQAEVDDCQGFEYTIGKVRGGELKVVFEPDTQPGDVTDVTCIDGVDGFGYCLVRQSERYICNYCGSYEMEFSDDGFAFCASCNSDNIIVE